MICDAHVHVGYYDRKGYEGPFYYSPRRVCSVLRRCGVDEFIFSSTSMQTNGVVFTDVHEEAREVVRIWGDGAHPFLWVTKDYLAYDPKLSVLEDGLYEGIKLHGRETPWFSHGLTRQLAEVMNRATEACLPVVVHTGLDEDSHPRKWLKWASRYSCIRFDFAHGAPFDVIEPCLAVADNVFVDLACVGDEDVGKLAASGFTARVLWGTDFPVLASRSGVSLTEDLRSSCRRLGRWDARFDFVGAFHRFLKGE